MNQRGYVHRDELPAVLRARIPAPVLRSAVGIAIGRGLVDTCEGYLVPARPP